jgi:hypothetical protein
MERQKPSQIYQREVKTFITGERIPVKSEYDRYDNWTTNLEEVDPRYLQAGESLRKLFKHPYDWKLEAFREETEFENPDLYYVFHNRILESLNFRKKDLVFDLKNHIVEEVKDGGENYFESRKGKVVRMYVDDENMVVEPFAYKWNRETDPYVVGNILISSFPLYPKEVPERHTWSIDTYEKADPAKIMMAISLDNPLKRIEKNILNFYGSINKTIGDLTREVKEVNLNKEVIAPEKYEELKEKLTDIVVYLGSMKHK